MGSHRIVEISEVIESVLLRPQGFRGRSGGSFAEGSVHAFVSAVLIRFSRLDEFGNDAELDPGDGEL